MAFMYITVALALGLAAVMLLMSRHNPKTFTRSLWWALALVALGGFQGYAAYRENLVKVELEQTRIEIEAIRADVSNGRGLTSEEIKKRSDRLKELSERLETIRRR